MFTCEFQLFPPCQCVEMKSPCEKPSERGRGRKSSHKESDSIMFLKRKCQSPPPHVNQWPCHLCQLGGKMPRAAGQGGGPTRRSTMLGLLFLSVFTAWKTSTVLWCRSISQTMLMAQNVPLRPPPFLWEEKSDGRTCPHAAS